MEPDLEAAAERPKNVLDSFGMDADHVMLSRYCPKAAREAIRRLIESPPMGRWRYE